MSEDERSVVEQRARSSKAPYREVIRARIVLYAAEGMDNVTIAARLDSMRSFVSRVRKRFHIERLKEPRSVHDRAGRFVFSPKEIASIKAVACELPAQLDLPFSRFSIDEVRRAVVERGVVESISTTTLWELLHEDGLRPWNHRPWIFPRDPEFFAKGSRVVDLYERRWEGKPLGESDFVISADEKTSIQARRRKHQPTPPGPHRSARIEHEYERKGALAYLAAYDNSSTGAAWVWTRSGGVWTQQGSKLVGSGAVEGAYGGRQGFSVCLSADGNTAIVGGYLDNGGSGAAWVFSAVADSAIPPRRRAVKH